MTKTQNQLAPFALSLVLFGVSCSDVGRPEADLGVVRAAISNVDARVLGFEELGAWTRTNGAASLAMNSAHVEGAASLAVSNVAFVELTSRPLASLAIAGGAFSLDVSLPSNQPNPNWYGLVQIFVDCPTANLHQRVVAERDLTGLERGTFSRLQFMLPSDVQSTLGTKHDDLRFKVVLNVPQNPSSYLLDRLSFVAAPDDPGTGGGQRVLGGAWAPGEPPRLVAKEVLAGVELGAWWVLVEALSPATAPHSVSRSPSEHGFITSCSAQPTR